MYSSPIMPSFLLMPYTATGTGCWTLKAFLSSMRLTGFQNTRSALLLHCSRSLSSDPCITMQIVYCILDPAYSHPYRDRNDSRVNSRLLSNDSRQP